MSDGVDAPDAVDLVARLHQAVELMSRPIRETHAARLQCKRGCSACCVDELTVFDVEAALIRRHHGELLDRERPYKKGACAFLDEEGACRIYAQRPYVCRTQGLPLRWFQETEADAGDLIEYRDICTLNRKGEPLQDLAESACWTIGVVERKLYALQSDFGQGLVRRTALRSLFKHHEH